MLWPHGRRSPSRQRLARRSSLAKGSLTSRRRCSHCPVRPLPPAAIKPRSSHRHHHPSCEGGRCVPAPGSNLNHECGIIRSRHREPSNCIDWVCSRWSEHIRWQSIEGTRSRKERDLAHHAGTRSRKAFPYVLDRVPSEIAFLTYNCM